MSQPPPRPRSLAGLSGGKGWRKRNLDNRRARPHCRAVGTSGAGAVTDEAAERPAIGLTAEEAKAEAPHFSYFRFFDDHGRAARVWVSETETQFGAEVFDAERDRLVTCVHRLGRFGNDPWIDEVTEADFDRLVAAQRAAADTDRARAAGEPWPKPKPPWAPPPARKDRVVLRPGGWITDAVLRTNGDLAFGSGDGSREWYATVAAANVEALRDALERDLGPAGEDDAPLDLLGLVAARFTVAEDAPNPFNAIKVFLDQAGIPWKSDVW